MPLHASVAKVGLRELEGLGSSVADERAVREIGERVKDCIRDRRSCMVETGVGGAVTTPEILLSAIISKERSAMR